MVSLPSKKVLYGMISVLTAFFLFFGAQFVLANKERFFSKKTDTAHITVDNRTNNPSQNSASLSNLPSGLWAGASTTDDTLSPAQAALLDPNNLTTRIAQGLSTEILAKGQSGSLESSDDTEIINKALENLNVNIDVVQYNQSNISIFSPKNKDEIKDYANKTAEIYVNEGKSLTNRNSFPTNEEGILFYNTLAKKLLSVPVPTEIAQAHLDLINNFSASYGALIVVNQYKKDPAKGVLAIKSFSDLESNRASITDKIVNYFKINGIIFNTNDAGALWYKTVGQ